MDRHRSGKANPGWTDSRCYPKKALQSEHCKVSLLHACKEKKMDVMVLIDSFKGSMTSMEAGNAARDGVLRVYPHANVTVSIQATWPK